MTHLTALTITGAQVLHPDGLSADPITVDAGRIIDEQSAGRRLYLPGCIVLPGIVDIHGDGFERHLAPRRGAMRNLGDGLTATEAELAANGITTAMLAQFWSWEGGMRSPDFARRFLDALDAYDGMGTDMQAQLRFETHLLDDYDAFEETVAHHKVRQVVFNDHLPHEALARGKRPPRLTGQALKSGRSPEAHLALLQQMHDQTHLVPEVIAQLAARLNAQGVVLGSHDDQTVQTRNWWHGLDVCLSEFPETPEAAQAARAGGDGIVLGAPNVVRGGSHTGKVSASDLARAGLCDALASDYHYPAPRQAALGLAPDLGLEAAWALVSSAPAHLLGLTDRGTLAENMRADIVVLDETQRVTLTIAAGRITYASGQAAAALLAAGSS